MMTDCGSFEPDKAGIRDAVLDDLDEATLKLYLSSKFDKVLHKKGISGDVFKEASLNEICSAIAKGHDAEHLLRNLHFIRPDGNLTLAAILLFGKYTQRWLPVMTAKCICFAGNSVGGKLFRDKVSDEDMEGNLLHQFNMIMNFYSRNLRTVQIGDEFNQQGRLEIPYTSLVEFTVNALVHRSLNLKAPVRIFIFDNRVEIHSPGALPNGLTVEDIISGTSLPRNTFLFDNAIHLLPYTGAGSGIARALNENLKVEFTNNEKISEFLITIRREENNQVEEKAVQGVNLDTNYGDLDTKHSHSEGDLGTKPRHYKDDLDTRPGHSEDDPDTKIHHLDTQKKPLTNKQREIINFCSVPRTTREILERIGVSMHTKNREHYIKPLVEAGYLQMTNPDNPTASNQKYRKA